MHRSIGFLLLIIVSLVPAGRVAAQPAITTAARAYLGQQPQIGPTAEVVDARRGLIYRAFLGSGSLLVINADTLQVARQWSIPVLGPIAATPRLALSPGGERIGLLVTARDQALVAVWEANGTAVGVTNLTYDNRPLELRLSARRAFVLRQGLHPLVIDRQVSELGNLPPVAAPAAEWSADGRTLAYVSASGADRASVTLLDADSLVARPTTFDAPAAASFFFAAAGERLYVATCGGIAQIELASGSVTRNLSTEVVGCLTDVVVSPDGLTLLAIAFSSADATSIVEVDVPTWQPRRRFDVEGSFGRLVAAWDAGRLFVSTQNYTTLAPVFSGVLDLASGALSRLPYAVSRTNGTHGFSFPAEAIKRVDPRTGEWLITAYGGTIDEVARSAAGAIVARVGGVVAYIPPGAAGPERFFPGGAGMALAGNRLFSHDGTHVFVSELTGGSRVLARLPQLRAESPILFDPATNRLIMSWITTPRNASAQVGLAIIDATTGAVDTSLSKPGSQISMALDPTTHRVYAATTDLTMLALETGMQTRLATPGIGFGGAEPVSLAFDAARGLLAISDGTTLAAHDRGGAQRWRLAVPGPALAVNGANWSVAGPGGLAVIEPQTGRQMAHAVVGYTLTHLGQSGSLTYGVDTRSGAVISAQVSGSALLWRIEGQTDPITTFDTSPDLVIFGNSGGLITTSRPQPGTAGRGNRSTFHRIWQRADEPVASGVASRSWTWGPRPWAVQVETYAESPSQMRLVEYRDKTRMEVTRPQADSNSLFYVTNGLLVAEMLRGEIQVGDQQFVPHPCPADRERFLCPRETRVAGDLAGNDGAPTYTDMNVLTGRVSRAVGQRTGATFTRDATGRFARGEQVDLATDATTLVEYDAVTGHHIARVFWQYMSQRGPVIEGGRVVNAQVVDPLSAFGRPLTDPAWVQARVDGVVQPVLVQLFERRVLTYTPGNPDPFKVEMGNVGQHYYLWRYGATRW